MSDSVRPHRWQPTRLCCPWDSPGKNTGVGCHFLLQCRKVKSESEVTQSCPTLRDPMDRSLPGSSVHGIFQARVLEWGAIAFSTFHEQFHLKFRKIELSYEITWENWQNALNKYRLNKGNTCMNTRNKVEIDSWSLWFAKGWGLKLMKSSRTAVIQEVEFWVRVKCKCKTFSKWAVWHALILLWADTICFFRLYLKQIPAGGILCCLMAYFISLSKWSLGKAENLNLEFKCTVQNRKEWNVNVHS